MRVSVGISRALVAMLGHHKGDREEVGGPG